ncbi:MAG: cysteine desulfurase [Alphaproteobacteria bacterium]|nr:MAG: cysteine desulfurase [Alphaproteobacteria bacterium]
MTVIRAAERLNSAPYDVERVRQDFPILSRLVHGKPLVFLDSAASAQKPRQVIEAELKCYADEYANVHRGVYHLSALATQNFEAAREKVARFLNARTAREIVFTRSATEAINLVASSYGDRFLREGDEVIISAIEHHSNIVPWQMLRDRKGIVLKVVPVDDRGAFMMEEYERLLGPRTRLVAVAHISNALGTVLPVAEITRLAHAEGAKVLIDGCQAAPHQQLDMQALDCDFYAFSAHKVYGPTGIGALYGRAELLEAMPPYQGGGDMIRTVSFEKTEYADIPARFEAGTPNIAGAIGFGAAVDYVVALGLDRVESHEGALLGYALDRLREVPGLTMYGTAADKASIVSFTLDGVHPHDIGTILDERGIAVRAGHHCAQPTMDRFGVAGTVRASFGLYNRFDEVDALVDGLRRVREIFG